MKFSKRIELLPPYLFAEIDRKKKAAIDRGIDIISLGVGDPDLPTPEFIIKAGQARLWPRRPIINIPSARGCCSSVKRLRLDEEAL